MTTDYNPPDGTPLLWELELPTRTLNALLRAGYNTVEILLGTHAHRETREQGPHYSPPEPPEPRDPDRDDSEDVPRHQLFIWPAWKDIRTVGRLGVIAIEDALEQWKEEQRLLKAAEAEQKQRNKYVDEFHELIKRSTLGILDTSDTSDNKQADVWRVLAQTKTTRPIEPRELPDEYEHLARQFIVSLVSHGYRIISPEGEDVTLLITEDEEFQEKVTMD